MKKWLPIIFILLLGLSACASPEKTGEVVFMMPTAVPAASVRPVLTAPPTPVPTPTPTPVPTPVPTPTPEPPSLLGGKYEEMFSDTVETDEWSYRSHDVSVTVTRHTMKGPVVYFVADVYIKDITSFKTAYQGASPLNGKTLSLTKYYEALRPGPLLMMNGDYCSFRDMGVIIRNGTLFRAVDSKRYDLCALTKDGVLHTLEGGAYTTDDVLALDPWQCWCFGPSLLDENGRAKTKFNSSLIAQNPRSVLGYYEPGHYCFVVVEGRKEGYSVGLSMKKLSALMEELGCTAAYNLDGGGSSQLRLLDKKIVASSRGVSDILFIAEPDYAAYTDINAEDAEG